MKRTTLKYQLALQAIRFLTLFLFAPALAAQSFLIADSSVQTIEAREEAYQDFIIPLDISNGELNLEIEGADGGWIEYSYLDRFGTRRTQRVNGGEGATISATYSVGYDNRQIPPGATLRFVIGNRGEWAKYDLLSQGGYGAGGGGGTAVLISNDGGSNWQILMVAGGGGGAGVDTEEIDTRYNRGLPGYSGDDGIGTRTSRNETMPGGKRGTGGQSSGHTGGGGGAFEDGQHAIGDLYYGNAGWKNHKLSGQPIGGLGGTQEGLHDGGWGFGGGGSGAEGGGGGGGYSGGGAGTPGFGGEGGSSYVNTLSAHPLNISKKQNGDTNNPEHGRVRYQFSKVEN